MANAARVRELVQYIETATMKSERIAFAMRDWYVEIDRGRLLQLRPEVINTQDQELLADLEEETPKWVGKTCGTAMCFAGFAQDKIFSENGWAFVRAHDAIQDSGIVDGKTYWSASSLVTGSAAGAGYELLELTGDEWKIFFDFNIKSLDDLKAATNHYFNEEIFEDWEYNSDWTPENKAEWKFDDYEAAITCGQDYYEKVKEILKING